MTKPEKWSPEWYDNRPLYVPWNRHGERLPAGELRRLPPIKKEEV
jgi:hypothetical protein